MNTIRVEKKDRKKDGKKRKQGSLNRAKLNLAWLKVN